MVAQYQPKEQSLSDEQACVGIVASLKQQSAHGFGRKSIIIVFIIIFYFELSNVEGYALIISLEYL